MRTDPLPDRPIRLRLPTQGRPAAGLAMLVFALLALGFLGYVNVPGLITDYRIGAEVAPAKGARLLEGRCRSKLVVHWCDARIEHHVGGARTTTSQSFIFFDLHFGAYQTSVVQRRGDPTLVSTRLALDSLWNRVATLAVLMGIFLVLGGAGVRELLRARASDRRFRHLDGSRLQPIPVDVLSVTDQGSRGAIWHYGPPGATQPISEVRFPRKIAPFFVGDRRALAVTDGQGEPLLLDDGLSVIKLDRAEHERIQAWRASIAASQPAPATPAQGPIVQPA